MKLESLARLLYKVNEEINKSSCLEDLFFIIDKKYGRLFEGSLKDQLVIVAKKETYIPICKFITLKIRDTNSKLLLFLGQAISHDKSKAQIKQEILRRIKELKNVQHA